MKKILRDFSTISFIGLLLLVTACDPYGGYKYWVDNKSDSTIFAVLRENRAAHLETISIEPGSMTLLKKFETLNGLHDHGSDFLRYFDSLSVMLDVTSGLTIKKDFLKRSSWSYDQDKTVPGAGDNIYKLKINNQDL